MKPIKSIALLAAGVLIMSACDRREESTSTMGTGAPTVEETTDAGSSGYTHSMDDDAMDTGEGTGSVSEEAALEEMDMQREEDNREGVLIDETSSEPDNAPGGRGPRRVPGYEGIDNTSSEPDQNQ